MSEEEPVAPKRKTKSSHVHLAQGRWWFIACRRILIGLLVIGVIAVAIIVSVYAYLAKDYDLTKLGSMPERTIVVDRKDEVIGRLYGENRIIVPLNEVSPYFKDALLAREDSRFYAHGGVDFIGVARAMVRNLKDGRVVQGASTLTMQLARNSYPGLDDRSFHRKLVEVMLARRIEAHSSKDDIIEHYINRIFFGNGLYGIQRASNVYFGKHASQLTLGECALLAGIIRSPSRFSPFKNYAGAKRERDDVLSRMVQTKTITQAMADVAKAEELVLRAQPAFKGQGDYAMDAVKRDLDLILEQKDFEDGGLRVYTTLDHTLQIEAETALENRAIAVEKLKGYPRLSKAQFDASWDQTSEVPSTPYLQGAVTAIDNHTGGILAIVGGRDYRHSKYNRALQGERQIGSTIKPFVYAAAIARGVLPGTWIDDSPIPGDWSPGNSDGKFIGRQPMALGLIQSRNTMTVRVGDQAGLDQVMALLRDAGIGSSTERTRQIFIGNLGSSLKQLVSAFTVFPNQGVRLRPYLINRIEDRNGVVLYSTPRLEAEVMPPAVAVLTNRLLGFVMDQGTAATARSEYGFKLPCGGKTGTTNDYKDAWFIGYTPDVTCGVWMGCDKPETIMDAAYGGKLSLPVWCDVMKKAETLGYHITPMPQLPNVQVNLCRTSSLLATANCRAQGAAYDDTLPHEIVPQGFCPVHGVGGLPSQATPTTRSTGSQPGIFDRIRGWFGR
jgi:penicillin-binding protein 1A